MNHAVPHTTPPPCAEAREAFALELAGGPPPSPPVRAHATACAACADAIARIEEVWSVPAAAFPRPSLTPGSIERLLVGALSRAQEAPATAPVVPLPPPVRLAAHVSHAGTTPAGRGGKLPAVIGLALAASLAALALRMPLPPPPVATRLAESTPAPAPSGTPGVRLAAAKGDVSFVPADGTILAQPKPGDALPPGLFAASGGAALTIEDAGTLAVRGNATVLIGGTEREPVVTIARGEIFVDLPKGSIRSFHVQTPSGLVRVTGTQFGVTVDPRSTTVEVTRGAVVVSSPDGERVVEAGHAADLSPGKVPALVAPADPAGDPRGWVRDLSPDLVGPKPPVAVSMRKTAPLADGSRDEELHEVSGLDRLAIENAMSRRDAAFRRCYELALVKEAGLSVRAEIRFRVDEDGRAENVHVTGLPQRHLKMAGCLMDATKAAVFPGAAPGTEVEVSYPVTFVPPHD